MISSALLLGQARPPSTLLNGLKGYWKLDGDGADALGANNGTPGGFNVTWGAGRVGQALQVTGSGYIDVGSSLVLKPTAAISVTAWVWFNGAQGGNLRCLTDWHQNGALDRWILGYSPDGITLFSHVGANSLLGVIGTTIPTMTWVQIGFSATQAGGYPWSQKTYLNGVPAGTGTAPSLGTVGGGPICIGCQYNTGVGVNGRVDEPKLWDRVLTDAEFAEDYANGLSGTPLL